MRMSGSQSFDRKNPSSPGSACCGDNVSKFSLLCQQLNHNNGSQHQQTPSSSHSSAFGFSLEAHLQPRSHSQQQPTLSRSHPQPPSHSQTQPQTCRPQGQSGENGLCAAAGYDNGNRVFPLGVEQGYGSGYVSQELQDNSVRGLLKISPPDSPSFQATSPQALMTALSVLQQKIQQLQAVVQLIAQGGEQSVTAMAQQQAVATGVTSVVSQLIVTIAGILQQPAMTAAQPMASDTPLNHILGGDTGSGFDLFQNSGISSPLSAALGNTSSNSFVNYGNIGGGNGSLGVGLLGSMPFGGAVGNTGLSCSGVGAQSLGGQGIASLSGTSQQGSLTPNVGNTSGNSLSIAGGVNGSNSSGVGVGSSHGADGVGSLVFANGSAGSQLLLEEHDPNSGLRDDDDDGEGENLPPGSYELVEMEAIEILAEHTHFCEICGKGFKRDANLRMHMRGHGDEYKTPAALARPDKFSRDPSTVRPRRYSCPYEGCKRNKKHRKFLPLKTMLCVKNHYRRSHCPKMLTCTKCKTKKFSVVADLKTHEKHCGRDKWQCSCGTTFSRKDKLLGHIGLFAGHKSAYPLPDVEGCGGASEAETSGDRAGISNETTFLAGPGSSSFGHGSGTTFGVDMVAGHGSIMDVGSGSMLGVGIAGSLGRTRGLQNLGQRAGSLSFSNEKIGQSLGSGRGPLVSGHSMINGLFSSNLLQQTNVNNQNSDVFQ